MVIDDTCKKSVPMTLSTGTEEHDPPNLDEVARRSNGFRRMVLECVSRLGVAVVVLSCQMYS